MQSLIESWDGEFVVNYFDRSTGSWIFIGVHSTKLGVATGGTRLKTYPALSQGLEDALRLSKGMTLKWAILGLPRGGGKGVIAVPGDFRDRDREGLFLRYGELVEKLGGIYETGPDLGTSSSDMDIIARKTSHVFATSPEKGGAGGSGPATALGVFSAIKASCDHLFGDSSLEGRRILVQGVGGVGAELARMLKESGAEVMVTDIEQERAKTLREEIGVECVDPEEVYTTDCDIFSPCAVGGILNKDTIPKLKARIVCGAANNQLQTPSDGESLKERGVLYAPDFVVNAGAAIYLLGVEKLKWSKDKTEEEIRRIGETLRKVYKEAEEGGIPTEEAALRIAEKNLSRVS
jgi:leucine dehydrogenase